MHLVPLLVCHVIACIYGHSKHYMHNEQNDQLQPTVNINFSSYSLRELDRLVPKTRYCTNDTILALHASAGRYLFSALN